MKVKCIFMFVFTIIIPVLASKSYGSDEIEIAQRTILELHLTNTYGLIKIRESLLEMHVNNEDEIKLIIDKKVDPIVFMNMGAIYPLEMYSKQFEIIDVQEKYTRVLNNIKISFCKYPPKKIAYYDSAIINMLKNCAEKK